MRGWWWLAGGLAAVQIPYWIMILTRAAGLWA
jgi:hypothetical protein